jgi:hypothetical protein
MSGFKQRHLKKCAFCDKGVMHDGNLVFYRVSLSYMLVDVGAVQRQTGLEMMMGAAAALAQHMGPDEDIAHEVSRTGEVLICLECANTNIIAELSEHAGQETSLERKP